MKIHKRFKKLLASVLVVMLLLSMTAIPASAGGILGDLEMETSAMNELSVRAAINSYFSQRLSFLKGEIDSIDVINEGMMADEIAHKTHLEEENIVMQSSNVAITSVSCWDNMAVATATETAVFVTNGETVAETIVHEVTLCFISDVNAVVLQSDKYTENSTGFSSCSYISPEELARAEIQIVSGSGSCMSYVAYKEIDEAEDEHGVTKYGQWVAERDNSPGLADDDWCAMFVLWCAYHADISYDVIPYYYSPRYIRNTLYYEGNYQTDYSSAVQPGDLIFINGTSSVPEHIGIVQNVIGNNVYFTDGNWGNQVAFRSLKINDSSIVGFGTPGYRALEHHYLIGSHGVEYCSHCGYQNLTGG